MSITLETAQAATLAGMAVVRVAADGTKRPLGEWKKWQTERPSLEHVEGWFGGGYAGIGVVCGAVSGGLTMLELEGRAVDEDLDLQLEDAMTAAGLEELWHRITAGWSERSPSGGLHLLYRRADGGAGGNQVLARRPSTPDELAGAPDAKVQVLIETRGEGGFTVVAPSNGTTHPTGRPWELLAGGPSAVATITPAEELELFAVARTFHTVPARPDPAPKPAPSSSTRPLAGGQLTDRYNADHTPDEVLERHGCEFHHEDHDGRHYTRSGKERRDGSSAVVWATNELGAGPYGTATLFSTSFNVAADVIGRNLRAHSLEVELGHGGDFASFHRDELVKYRQTNELDAWTPSSGHDLAGHAEGGDEAPASFADRIRSALLTTAQVKELEPPAAIVEGLLYVDSLAMLYGPSGIGKSFVAADLALHVAFGAWWQGREVAGGPVLYVVAEGAGAFGQRIEAWEKHHNLRKEVHPVHWLPWAVNIFDPAWAAGLAKVVAERRPALVILDTFARCAVGAEENSAKDVGLVIANLDTIRRASGACVLTVHHSGMSLERGARGSTALRGAMTTELELSGKPARLTLKSTKQKDAPEAPPIPLGLLSIEGTDSVAVDRAGTVDPANLAESVADTLTALMEIDVPEGVPVTVWLDASALPKTTFYRNRTKLVELGLVENIGTDPKPRYRPKSAPTGVWE